MSRKCKKVSVLLDSEEYERFEAFCEERAFKKSTLIVRLIREHLDTQGFRRPQEPPLSASHERGRG